MQKKILRISRTRLRNIITKLFYNIYMYPLVFYVFLVIQFLSRTAKKI